MNRSLPDTPVAPLKGSESDDSGAGSNDARKEFEGGTGNSDREHAASRPDEEKLNTAGHVWPGKAAAVLSKATELMKDEKFRTGVAVAVGLAAVGMRAAAKASRGRARPRISSAADLVEKFQQKYLTRQSQGDISYSGKVEHIRPVGDAYPCPDRTCVGTLGGMETLFSGGYMLFYEDYNPNVPLLAVSTPDSPNKHGGVYDVKSMRCGAWYVLCDRRGHSLPVAACLTKAQKVDFRVDPEPLEELPKLRPRTDR